MNELVHQLPRMDLRAGRIVLAHEPPFRIGPLAVSPAMRRVAHDDGREDILEQRIMQVLVALVRAEGAVLTREELIDACWDGRIVGDDAINRVMSRLRRLAEGLGKGVLRIETITKVGYRLVTDDGPGAAPAGPAAGDAPPSDAARRHARRLRIGLAAIATAVLAGFLLPRPGAGADDTVVRVDPFEVRAVDGAAANFGRDLAADLSHFANAVERGFAVIEPGASGGAEADYAVRASISSAGGQIRATARLVRTRDGEIVWSRTFERPATEAAGLREQMAVRIADLMTCAKTVSERGAGRLAPNRCGWSIRPAGRSGPRKAAATGRGKAAPGRGAPPGGRGQGRLIL